MIIVSAKKGIEPAMFTHPAGAPPRHPHAMYMRTPDDRKGKPQGMTHYCGRRWGRECSRMTSTSYKRGHNDGCQLVDVVSVVAVTA